ncbi:MULTISPECIES: magnesium chelatase domain-containing protein [unclassified Nitratiruptor]|uniref:magnesium chelatase domain-containing protein n=1 Tax=unclassified Nitratiruptor TaxID=2624044 RepID=UPI00191563F7|nr:MULTISPECIES: magnesium chelatase domain-containing protein [unclassified Nitratiruptor]BCD59434.1 Mg chelatase-related protein [Nitratiruptor sp. YY08-10]BCD63358.1 magnesium chelatase family protein [Nitratiruptor sp. YY08-14]
MKKIFCATLDGVDAKVVEVESSFIRALPALSIVGLASSAIQEAKDRVKSALLANNFSFPPQKITINLAPSDLKKNGSHFDLAIALGIALQKEDVDFEDYFVFGELGLDGAVKDTMMIFPLVLSLAKKPVKVVIPLESLPKVQKIPNIDIVAVQTLSEAIAFFKTKEAPSHQPIPFSFPHFEMDGEKYYYNPSYPLDFSEVKGQEVAKRAALIAAAGCHNLLMEGSPGCGKSMIAKRLRYILPPMSMQEILDMAKMEALDGKEPSFTPLRSYRSPHHSSTKASIFGGGCEFPNIIGLFQSYFDFFQKYLDSLKFGFTSSFFHKTRYSFLRI